MIVKVDDKNCDQCGTCISVCTTDSLWMDEKLHVEHSTCSACGKCIRICPFGALSLVEE